MQTHESVFAMQQLAREARAGARTLAFVPTMGALHEGHLDLVRLAATRADIVVVSIFVNPTQFGPNEDFDRYPQDREGDLAKLRRTGTDHVFLPARATLFPEDYSTFITEESVAQPLEAISRPTHFRGVTTVVAQLFHIVQPDYAVFGQKDAQQLAVVRKMVADLHLPIEIIAGPTKRDADGLALSSRNAYLTAAQRQAAIGLPRTLEHVEALVAGGERRAERLIAEATRRLEDVRGIRVIYVAVVDPATMQPQADVQPGNSLMAIAVELDEIRLIDNVLL